MDFINPNSFSVSEGYVEPVLATAKAGDSFQFQRLGYFCVDKDSNSDQLVFNKTVGLRDSWAKQKPKPQEVNNPNISQQNYQRPAIEEIKKLGKKYTNLPVEKQQIVKKEIQELAKKVTYEELQPLFATAAKKHGTRIAAMITLGVLLASGQDKKAEVLDFIKSAASDSNELLVAEAKALL
jgi:glutaminyl-tRNA synthetase